MSKQIEAMLVADRLAALDNETLQLVAGWLVIRNPQKADSLQFALNAEIHEMMVSSVA